MNESERWQKVKEVLHQLLEREPDARAAFLAQVCDGDESLRKEVEALLASYDQAGSFFDKPAAPDIAKLLKESQAESPIGQTLGPYQIRSKLGAGGMGEVYLAEDTRLHRPVALKLLAAHFTRDEERVGRFRQEAFAASSLNHPNIVTVYEIGEWQGRHFIASEFVEGVTFRTRLRGRRLTLPDTLDIAIQIAGALSAAHKAGIVHRDIKPENVMVRPDGLVKVLDFGIAKYTQPTRVMKEAMVKTMQGALVGTAAYMSPEQARGQPVDHRTDIWSLGAILYEMVARRLPFPGATPTDRIAAILEREPAPISARRKLPPELDRIIKRALAKDREQRYAHAADLADDLRKLRATVGAERPVRFALPQQVRDLSVLPRQRLLIPLFAVLLVIGIGVFIALRFVGGPKTTKSLAVLPFVNASSNQELDYLSDGLAETLINNLSHLPNVKVMSRSAVFRYKGKDTDAQTVGRELGVESVLTGRVVSRDDDLTINVELVDTHDNSHMWGEQYNRKLADLLAVQLEISRHVSEQLRLPLTGLQQQRVTKQFTQNHEAYQLYMKGRYYLERRTAESIKRAVKYLQQATDLDPHYALAYAELANAYHYLGDYELVQPKETYLNSKAAVLKALEIDDTLGEAHAQLADLLHIDEWDWSGAEREFKRAIELNPNYGEAHHAYSHYLLERGRVAESLAESKWNLELDPLSPATNLHLGWHYLYSRQFDQAITEELKTLEMDPNYARAYLYLAQAYEQNQMFDQAVEAYLKHRTLDGANPEEIVALKNAYASGEITGFWRKSLELKLVKAKSKHISSYDTAAEYARIGDKEQALQMLEKAYTEHSQAMVGLNLDFAFDSIRTDPRFKDLVRRVGLPN